MRGHPGEVRIQHNKAADVFFVTITKEVCEALGIRQTNTREAKWEQDTATGRWFFDLRPICQPLDDGVPV